MVSCIEKGSDMLTYSFRLEVTVPLLAPRIQDRS